LKGKGESDIARPELIRLPPRPENNRLKRRAGRIQRTERTHPTNKDNYS